MAKKLSIEQIPTSCDFTPMSALAPGGGLSRLPFTLREVPIGENFDLATKAERLDGAAITEERRVELLRAVNQGEPIELTLDAVVFRQSTTPRPLPAAKRREANHNRSCFHPDELESLAKSFKGRQFLRDHDRGSLEAVGGRLLSSRVETSGNWSEFRQTIHLVKKWAVVAALDGTLATFSIGWDPKASGWAGYKASLFCSVCDAQFFGGDCQHMVGDEVKLADGGGRVIVELQWRSVTGAETSGVSFPAVEKTSIVDIRAALAAARPTPPKERSPMLNRLRKELGLAEDATAEEILAAQSARHETELRASEEGRKSSQAALAEYTATQEAAAATALANRAIASREAALADGRLKVGDDRDKLYTELVEIDIEKAERFLGALSSVTPVGQPMQLDAVPAAGDKPVKMDAILVEEYDASPEEISQQRKQAPQLGITDEDFVKYGQHTLEEAS